MSKVLLKLTLAFVKLCGVIVFMLGFTATVGHTTKILRLHTWYATPMSVNTSLALIFAGLGLFICGRKLEDLYEERHGNPP